MVTASILPEFIACSFGLWKLPSFDGLWSVWGVQDKDQRSLDIETAKAMLGLLLGGQWSLLAKFSLFLDQSRYRVVNKDQWCNVLEFSRAVDPDLKNYDVDGACQSNVPWIMFSIVKLVFSLDITF